MAIRKKDYDPAAMQGAVYQTENQTAAITLTTKDTEDVYFLNNTAGFAVTLPTVENGLHFTFIVKTQPTSGSYTVTGASGTVKGQAVNSAAGAGSTTTGGTTITFAQSQTVAGDKVEVFCDGTYWYATAQCAVAAGITLA